MCFAGIFIFQFLSAFCVKNNITYSIPLSDDVNPLDTWITVLAPSGSAKTFSTSQIKKMIPSDLAGEKLIEQNFTRPNGAAKIHSRVVRTSTDKKTVQANTDIGLKMKRLKCLNRLKK